VEWGFRKETLSFSRKKELPATHAAELTLPTASELQSLAIHEIPGKLDRTQSAGWSRGILASGHVYGPVLGKRWSGNWQGPELSFEVWLVRSAKGSGYEPVVELSFKADTQPSANDFREKLLSFTYDEGWLLEREVLKTTLILQRY
jgi:hypothetical protein